MEAEENFNDEGDAGEEEGDGDGDDITDYDSTGDGSLPMNIASTDDTTSTTTPSSARKRKLSISNLPSDPTTPTANTPTATHTPRTTTDTALATSSLIARFIQPNFPMFENKEKVWVVDAFGADNDDLMAYVNASAAGTASGGAKGGVKVAGGSATQAM